MKLNIQLFAVTYTGPEVVGNYSWAKIQGRVTCEETYVGTSAENNSTVKCTVEVRCTTGGTQAANWRMGVTCNGVEKTAKSTYNMEVASDWKVINTVVFENVPHNEDGSKVVAISGYAQAPEYATSLGNAKSSFSGNMTLTTIPRESSISADKTSLTLDETVRISINRKSNTFYEDLLITYVSGDTGKTTTETVKVTNTYYNLKLTSDKFKNITGPSGVIYITAITYDASGNRVAQTNQVGVSVTIPNTMVPTLTVGDLYEDGTIVPSSWGVFVKGKSEIGVPVNASGINGSTIKNITMRDSNTTGEYVITGSSGIFSTAKVVADGTLTFTATDSRDKTAKVTKNYTVVDYSDPKLTEYTAKKVNGNNIEDENGQYVMFSIGGNIADCAGNNVKRLYVSINNKNNWIDVTNNPTNSTITSQTIDPNSKNIVYFKITDSLGGSDVKSAELDSVFKLMNFNKTLTSVAVGKKSSAADGEKLFEVGMPTKFYEPVKVPNVVSRNLFNINMVNPNYNYETRLSRIENGIRATALGTGQHRYSAVELDKGLLGKTVTLSANINPSSTNQGSLSIFFGTTSEPFLSSVIGLTKNGSVTFTIPSSFPSGCDKLFMNVYSNGGGTGVKDAYVDYTNIQIEEGTTPSEYTSYLNLEEAMNKEEIYFTSEQRIGTWINGKPLYRKVLKVTPTGQYSAEYLHGIDQPAIFVNVYGTFHRTNTDYRNSLPSVYPNWEVYLYDFRASKFSMRFSDNVWNNGVTECYVVFEYTKYTD